MKTTNGRYKILNSDNKSTMQVYKVVMQNSAMTTNIII